MRVRFAQGRCIVSASRRTDIPAYYGEWFMNRVRAGWAVSRNPFNRKAVRVALAPSAVTGFVFWSKDYRPFLRHLDELDARGYQAVFMFTITGLPRVFEPRVPDTETAVETFRRLSRRYSPQRLLWRYDPIVVTNRTGADYHLRRFEELCRKLEGYTTRCYTSFASLYPKVKRRLRSLRRAGIEPVILAEPEQAALAARMAEIAARHGIEVYACCNDHLVGGLVKKAHCVDANLLAALAGVGVSAYRPRPTRRECGCYESVDIGMYDTCLYACVYCYANNGSRCAENHRRHNPESPLLIAGSERAAEHRWEAPGEQATAGWRQESFSWD
jgi:hypothetical protein